MLEPTDGDDTLTRIDRSTEGGAESSDGEAGDLPAGIELLIEGINRKLAGSKPPLPPEERRKVSNSIIAQSVTTREVFHGPLPPPNLLKEYEEICPGWATKILQMGLDEQQHRFRWEQRALDQNDRLIDLDHRDASYMMTGLILGFLALLVILGVGVYALVIGQTQIAVGCLGGSLIAAVVSVFINGRARQSSKADDGETKEPEKSATPPGKAKKRRP